MKSPEAMDKEGVTFMVAGKMILKTQEQNWVLPGKKRKPKGFSQNY